MTQPIPIVGLPRCQEHDWINPCPACWGFQYANPGGELNSEQVISDVMDAWVRPRINGQKRRERRTKPCIYGTTE